MSSSVINSTVASETNEKLASGFDRIQERIDRITVPSITLAAFRDGTDARTVSGFPAQYQAMATPPVAEKARVLNAMKGVYGHGALEHTQVVMNVSDEDVEAWKSKERMKQQIEFDQWIGHRYQPFTNPAEANWLQSIYPEYFQARIDENEALHELQAHWNKIQISGPKSKEDLYLLYRVETDPFLAKRLMGPTGVTKESKDTDYVRGFFNRSRYVRQDVGKIKLEPPKSDDPDVKYPTFPRVPMPTNPALK